jgi:hypothetical protein
VDEPSCRRDLARCTWLERTLRSGASAYPSPGDLDVLPTRTHLMAGRREQLPLPESLSGCHQNRSSRDYQEIQPQGKPRAQLPVRAQEPDSDRLQVAYKPPKLAQRSNSQSRPTWRTVESRPNLAQLNTVKPPRLAQRSTLKPPRSGAPSNCKAAHPGATHRTQKFKFTQSLPQRQPG